MDKLNMVKLVNYEVSNKIGISASTNMAPYSIALTNAEYMWKNGYYGKDVVIAIIDTGCDSKHPDLQGRILEGRNFTADDNSNPLIYEDYNGHGTHVAGIICANNKNKGVVGIAPQAKLLILKALDKNGSGTYQGLINALNYAIGKKVDIISMSLGGPNDVPGLHDIIVEAINKNILVVCAAGNRGDNNFSTQELDYPGSYEEVIEVGAIDQSKKPALFSNSNRYVDLLAPGVQILSTYKNQSYASLSGTSMATPYVSGGLALLIEWSKKEYGRLLSESELYAQLIKNTKSINYSRNIQGNGYLYLEPFMYNTTGK